MNWGQRGRKRNKKRRCDQKKKSCGQRKNTSVRTSMRLKLAVWDILGQLGTFWDILGHFGTILKTFWRIWTIQTVFPVISDYFHPLSANFKKRRHFDEFGPLRLFSQSFPTIFIHYRLIWKNAWRTDGPTDGPTDRWTDRRTDRPSYRDAWMHLKRV